MDFNVNLDSFFNCWHLKHVGWCCRTSFYCHSLYDWINLNLTLVLKHWHISNVMHIFIYVFRLEVCAITKLYGYAYFFIIVFFFFKQKAVMQFCFKIIVIFEKKLVHQSQCCTKSMQLLTTGLSYFDIS